MSDTIILFGDGKGWDVTHNGRICDRLTCDEALAVCAKILLRAEFPPYPFRTVEEHRDVAVKRAAAVVENRKYAADMTAAGISEHALRAGTLREDPTMYPDGFGDDHAR